MTTLGYTLSSEEFDPADLARHAVAEEKAGFDFAMVSDHPDPQSRSANLPVRDLLVVLGPLLPALGQTQFRGSPCSAVN